MFHRTTFLLIKITSYTLSSNKCYKDQALLHPRYKHNIFEVNKREFLPLKIDTTNFYSNEPPIIPNFKMHLEILLLQCIQKPLAPCHMKRGNEIKATHTPHNGVSHPCY